MVDVRPFGLHTLSIGELLRATVLGRLRLPPILSPLRNSARLVYDNGVEEALRRVWESAGTQFDNEIIHHFTNIVETQLGDIAQIAEPRTLNFTVNGE